MTQNPRYERNILTPEIGEEGQALLNKASILVVGAGGLGSPVLYYLAAAGVGNITIMDGDQVEISNLQRQIIHTEQDLGRNKAISAREKLEKLNSEIKIDAVGHSLTRENMGAISQKIDLIFDCTDNFLARRDINHLSLTRKIPFVYAAISGFLGQIAIFDPNSLDETGCYNCLFSDVHEEAEKIPVATTTPAIVGAFAACEGVKWILNLETSTRGNLLLVNSLTSDLKKIALSRSEDCTECAKNDKI